MIYNNNPVRAMLHSTTALTDPRCFMPQALPILITSAAAATTITAGVFAFSLSTFVISAALGFALSALAPKPAGAGADQGYQVNNVGAKNPHAIIYGRAVVGGPNFYNETTTGNTYLHRLIALAAHECDAIETVYFNDEALTLDGSGNVTAPSKWVGFARIKTHLGDQTTADSDLVSESEGDWTSSHKALGICYLYARLKFSRDAYPNGIPVITAKVRGKKVLDTRTSTTAWTDNAALIARDYITADYGLAATGTNDTAYSAAATVCDESVTLAAGGTESRYTINGAFSLKSTPRQILKSMHDAMAGYPVYGQGQWKSVVGEYTAATKTLDEDDLRSGLSVVPRHPRASNFNGVTGTFRGEESEWKETSYPPIDSSVFLTEDNGLKNSADFPLPFTDTTTAAQRIGKIALYRNREQLRFTAKFGLNAFDVGVGDVIQFTYTRWGWASKEFECVGWKFTVEDDGDLITELTLREISSAVFDWDAEELAFTLNNTTIPDAWVQAAVSITPSSELRVIAEKVVAVIIVDLGSNDAGYIAQYEVEFRKSSDTAWINLGTATGKKFIINDVEDELFDIRARAINVFGVAGDWTQLDGYQSDAFLAVPNDVANFAVNVVAGAAHFTWDANSDLDLSYYKIRLGTSWGNSIIVAPKVPRPATGITLPAKDGTYYIKAVDKTGNESESATSIQMSVNSIEGLNVVETITEENAWSGVASSTNITKSANSIVLTSVASAPSTGTYIFANEIDLGAKYTARMSFDIAVTRQDNAGQNFTDAPGLFTARLGLFTGTTGDFGDTNVILQLATTDDDPAGTPTWSAWQDFIVGDYEARAFKFRAILNSETINATPNVSSLSVTADMPDRTIAVADTASGTGGKAMTFSPSFKTLSGLGISAQGLASGDYYDITSKTATGFTIEFFNSGTTSIDKTFDYVAKGYGKITT